MISIKNLLWRKLLEIEKIASGKAAAKTGINFINITSGHTARALLNKKMGKKSNTKFKKYLPYQLQKALEIVDSPEFLDDLVAQFVEKGKDPELQLRVLRAKRLIDPTVEIPDELINQVKQQKPDKIQELWDKLTSLDIEVHDLSKMGKEVAFKISTPLHTYLDVARPKEIIKLAQKDIDIYQAAKCKGCGTPIDYCSQDRMGIGQCAKCGSIWGSIPENLGMFLQTQLFSDYGYDGIIYALKNWDDLYAYDTKTQYSWFLYNQLQSSKIVPLAQKIKTKLPKIIHSSIKVPVFRDEDSGWDEPPTCATCRLCAHVIAIPESTDFQFNNYNYYCVYPLFSSDVLDNLGLEYQPDYGGEYCEDRGIIWNIILDKSLELFVNVEREESLEGKAKDGFIGPICPQFVLDKNHPDLRENSGFLTEIGQETVTFGVVNFQRLQREAEQKQQADQIEQLTQKIRNLKDKDAIFKERVEWGEQYLDNFSKLRQFLAENFTKAELKLLFQNPQKFKLFFNVSNKMFRKVIIAALE